MFMQYPIFKFLPFFVSVEVQQYQVKGALHVSSFGFPYFIIITSSASCIKVCNYEKKSLIG